MVQNQRLHKVNWLYALDSKFVRTFLLDNRLHTATDLLFRYTNAVYKFIYAGSPPLSYVWVFITLISLFIDSAFMICCPKYFILESQKICILIVRELGIL